MIFHLRPSPDSFAEQLMTGASGNAYIQKDNINIRSPDRLATRETELGPSSSDVSGLPQNDSVAHARQHSFRRRRHDENHSMGAGISGA